MDFAIEFDMPSYEEFYRTPIYVHPTRKINYSTKNLCYTDLVKKNSQKKCKCKRKTVINKLEETYWSNWKPSKDDQDDYKFEDHMDCKKHTILENHKSKKCQGDSPDIVEHFTSTNYQNSTTSTDYFVKKRVSKQKHSIDVQTDLSAIEITKTQEKGDSNEPQTIKEELQPKTVQSETFSEKKDPVKSDSEDFWNLIEKESKNLQSTFSSVSIKHTDSLVILKKKQSESKEKIEQPKCLKLFNKLKSGTVNLSRGYMRGGSYPLSSSQGHGKTSLVLSNTKSKAKRSKNSY